MFGGSQSQPPLCASTTGSDLLTLALYQISGSVDLLGGAWKEVLRCS